MAITSLQISNFRNLSSVQISPIHAGLNIICGKNGEGKTSVLEAIYYLGNGKSFRSSNINSLIKHSADKFSLYTQLSTDLERSVSLGAERDLNGASKLRVDGKDVGSISRLASHLPIRVINSHSHQLLEAGPIFRRKYLDWGLFYQYPEFLPAWRQYERALKQRNSILKEKRSRNELDLWSEEVVRYGLEIDKLRKAYIQQLLPVLREIVANMLVLDGFDIEYTPGWQENDTLRAALEASVADEYRIGHTQSGPHRADFDLVSKGLSLKHILSRGQQKLMICAMILAQGMLLSKQENQGLIYLVDDLPSELDIMSRQKLISLLAEQNTQVFITAIEQETIWGSIGDETPVKIKAFHVEHGDIAENIEPSVQ